MNNNEMNYELIAECIMGASVEELTAMLNIPALEVVPMDGESIEAAYKRTVIEKIMELNKPETRVR